MKAKSGAKVKSANESTPATNRRNKSVALAPPDYGLDFADSSTGAVPAVQAKFTLSQPGDSFEREADQVADKVMRMVKPIGRTSPTGTRPNGQTEQSNNAPVMLKTTGVQGSNPGNSEASSMIQNVTGSSGQPLGTGTQAFFGSRFGHDFSSVRVHTNTPAAASAERLSARAYTTGSNVVFAKGQYAPETNTGKKLLAHELTHVLQQRNQDKGKPFLQRAIKSVTAASADGWLTVKHADDTTYPPLPQHLKVDTTGRRGGRDYFKIKESGHNGTLADTQASVTKKGDGTSFLGSAVTYGSSGTVTFNKTTEELKYGSNGPIAAKTDPANPVPNGTYDLEIPYEAHPGGANYTGDATFAKTWFRIGHSGDRFLHPGRFSAGCATVTSVSHWDSIYNYLIKRRKDDKKSVGTIAVS